MFDKFWILHYSENEIKTGRIILTAVGGPTNFWNDSRFNLHSVHDFFLFFVPRRTFSEKSAVIFSKIKPGSLFKSIFLSTLRSVRFNQLHSVALPSLEIALFVTQTSLRAFNAGKGESLCVQ